MDSIGGQAESGWVGKIAPTLKATHYKMPPCVAIQGSAGFCTEHSAKSRTIGYQEECSPTLRAGVTPAIVGVYKADDGSTGSASPTLVGDHNNRVTDHSALVVCYEPVVYADSTVIDVEMEVAVRKYEVDCKALCECLRDHKAASNFSNKEIAEQLALPLTMVEHWFRRDNSFAIPDPEVWPRLKKLLGIQTDEFDQSIMEFEFKAGNYDMRNRIHTGETAPTLTCGCGNDLHLVPEEPVYCLQGNGIDRADTAGCNGKGWKEDASYTLNTIDRPAVAYSLETFHCTSDEEKTTTLKARDYKDPVCVAYGVDCRNATEYPELNGCIQHDTYKNLNSNGVVRVQYIVRRLTPTECARLQGFADRWATPDKKSEFSDEEYRFWLNVRNTHAEINGKATKEYTRDQMLTWYNKLHTDSSEYKLWGNGIALPTALYVMQGIAEVLA
jgi:DNA (cytosine-5)-methyltransferase 1